MEILELKGVKKSYVLGQTVVTALKEINIKIGQGELVAVIGASGSGKSTLLNMMGCIDRPDSGEVLLRGQVLNNVSDDEISALRNRNLGFIFQSFNLIPVLTVFENIEVPLLLRDELGPMERKVKVIAMAEAVGLGSLLKNRPDHLSGGQRQRVAIARALVGAPQIVFADEPTANLDSENANKIVDLLIKLGDELKTTFIIASHDERLLSRVRRIVHIKDGFLSEDR